MEIQDHHRALSGRARPAAADGAITVVLARIIELARLFWRAYQSIRVFACMINTDMINTSLQIHAGILKMTKRFQLMTILYSKIATLAKDAKGAVLPTVAVVLVGLMGMATLAMDVSRYMDLQTQLQKAADSFALAAAAELDGRSTAITRANSAVTALMAGRNSSVFNTATVTAAVTYYPALPATDNLAMGATTTDPTQANFVQVVVNPVVINTFIPATLLGAANNNMTTSAAAVAGFTQSICKPTPLYVCNGSGATDMLNPAVMKGKEVSLVANPGNGVGGNYGFLDPLGCGGNTPCLENTLGENIPTTCANTPPIITTTGQKSAAGEYFDTRFDLYQQSAKKADPTVFSPDVNVRKGYTAPENCNKPSLDGNGWGPPPPASTNELPLPDDANIAATAPNYTNATIGDGNWQGNFSTYWSVNFPGVPKPATPATRYALYQYEIANGLIPAKSTGKEVGTPVCAPPADAQPNRRLLYAAVIDCASLGGSQTAVTGLGVVQFFLLRPTIKTGGFGTMLAEYVGVATPNDASGVLHDIVQLYR
jgi:Flp pilus assembly protein TadG